MADEKEQIQKEIPTSDGIKRDKGGKFVKGGKSPFAGHKSPHALHAINNRAIVDEVITPDVLRTLLKKQLLHALNGNVKCLENLIDRKLGKAAQPIQHSGSILTGDLASYTPAERAKLLEETFEEVEQQKPPGV